MNISADDIRMLDLLGHLGYFCLALGLWKIANDDGSGWAFRLLGEAVWVGISLQIGLWSGVIWGGLFMFVDVFGIASAVRAHNDNKPPRED